MAAGHIGSPSRYLHCRAPVCSVGCARNLRTRPTNGKTPDQAAGASWRSGDTAASAFDGHREVVTPPPAHVIRFRLTAARPVKAAAAPPMSMMNSRRNTPVCAPVPCFGSTQRFRRGRPNRTSAGFFISNAAVPRNRRLPLQRQRPLQTIFDREPTLGRCKKRPARKSKPAPSSVGRSSTPV
jgi:hypothetical protein